MHLPSRSEAVALCRTLRLPAPFLLGTAASGYQVEGGFNGPAGPRNNWASWETRPGNEPAGSATRFWDAPSVDLALARAMHLNAFRLGVEWARVQPDGPDAWDEGAVARYVRLLVEVRAHGLEPVVTLHHFTHPAWLGLDFWPSDDAPARFAAFVAGLVARLCDGLAALGEPPVRYWITLNEPNVLAAATYLSEWMPSAPARGFVGARFLRALDSLYAAHVGAYGVLHRAYADRGLPAPAVSFNNFAMDLYGLDRLFVDLVLSRSRGVAGPALAPDLADRARAHAALVAPITARAARQALSRATLARAVRLAAPILLRPARFPRLVAALAASDHPRPLDFVALDYYDAALANQLRLVGGQYDPWDWDVFPEGLHAVLRAYGCDGLPVLVAENGLATRRLAHGPPEPRADGVTRDAFLRAHVFQVLRAIADGVPLLGYLHWSVTDNYEWGRYAPRFGLHGIDFTDETRPRLSTDASGVAAPAAYARLARALSPLDPDALATALTE